MTKPKVERRKTPPPLSLSDQVTLMLNAYFDTLAEENATDVYEMVIQQVEKPMIEFVLQQTENNQSQAANILGINRNTLKKKMQKYNLV
ncbi:helix-turn-helix domain-containing protein [Thiomicrorhabdus sp. Kp2]|uniref:helix-turn-helix domain-containing protein n=1 Tax=Thiomicrorhabdus sp. Kp2 TaxID=1123518 RepID=UPI00040E422D|nr:helix-turn-helix domain-containing protein [Thiomicrorhabdus sp. Kp2]